MPAPGDRIATFFSEKTARRALALTLFVAMVFVFRKLALLLISFIAFQRGLDLTAGWITARFGWRRILSLSLVLSLAGGMLALGVWASAGRVKNLVIETRDSFPQRMAELRMHPWYSQLEEHLPDTEDLVQRAERYFGDIAKTAQAVGRGLVMALIGLILAVVFFLDEDRILEFRNSLRPNGMIGTLARWSEYLADSVSLTIQLQLVVAALNTILTLPVLLLIGVPKVAALMVLIFVTGLIPVVGNLISGAVLIVLAFQVKGWAGVIIFVSLTFVLHKIESYFLNPRLTARHVALPSFVLILSLIAWEHLLGFAGLFVSFPFLYLVGKIRGEFVEDDANANSKVSSLASTGAGSPPNESQAAEGASNVAR